MANFSSSTRSCSQRKRYGAQHQRGDRTILGVPVLTNGRLDLTELAKDAQKREAKAAQKNQKTQTLGNQHEALLVQRDGQQQEVDRLKGEIEALR